MFLIDKKTSVDKPLNLRSVSEHDNVLLQFTSAMLITNYNNVSLQMTIAWLLQFSTIQSIVISIYDRYYNLRRLLLQFTTGITIHDRTNITFRELKHQRRPRLRKRHLKSGFALPQTL